MKLAMVSVRKVLLGSAALRAGSAVAFVVFGLVFISVQVKAGKLLLVTLLIFSFTLERNANTCF